MCFEEYEVLIMLRGQLGPESNSGPSEEKEAEEKSQLVKTSPQLF